MGWPAPGIVAPRWNPHEARSRPRRGKLPGLLPCCSRCSRGPRLSCTRWSGRVWCALAAGSQVEAISAVLVAFFGGLALGARLLGPRADRVASPLRLYGLLEIGAGVLAAATLIPLAALGRRRSSVSRRGRPCWWRPAACFPPSTLLGGTLPALLRASVRGSGAARRLDRRRQYAGLRGGGRPRDLGDPGARFARDAGIRSRGLGGRRRGRADRCAASRESSGVRARDRPRGRLPAASPLAPAEPEASPTRALPVGDGARGGGRRRGGLHGVRGSGGSHVRAAPRLVSVRVGCRAGPLPGGPRRRQPGLRRACRAQPSPRPGARLGRSGRGRRPRRRVCPAVAFSGAARRGAGTAGALRPDPRRRAGRLPDGRRLPLFRSPGRSGRRHRARLRPRERLEHRGRHRWERCWLRSSCCRSWGPRWGRLSCAGVAALLAVKLFLAGSERLGTGLVRAGLACACVGLVAAHPPSANPVSPEPARVLFVAHGRQATAVVAQVAGRRDLIVDGDPEASTGGEARRTEELLAILPLLLHPAPERFLELGLGSGITLATAARFPLAEIDCVEIADSVIRASAFFAPDNGGQPASGCVSCRATRASSWPATRAPTTWSPPIRSTPGPWAPRGSTRPSTSPAWRGAAAGRNRRAVAARRGASARRAWRRCCAASSGFSRTAPSGGARAT